MEEEAKTFTIVLVNLLAEANFITLKFSPFCLEDPIISFCENRSAFQREEQYSRTNQYNLFSNFFGIGHYLP